MRLVTAGALLAFLATASPLPASGQELLQGTELGSARLLPGGIVVPDLCTQDTFVVTWSRSPRRPRFYQLQEATDPDFTTGLRIAYRGSRRRKVIRGRADGATYYYRVRGVRSRRRRSPWLAAANGCLVERTVAAPASIGVPPASDAASFMVSWGPSPSAGTSYELEESTDPGFAGPLRTAYAGPALETTITGREDATTYYYRVRATRAGSNPSSWLEGAAGCLVSLADTTPPGPVSDFSAVPEAQGVLLSWTNPADPDLAGVVVRRATGAPPTAPDEGTPVCDVAGESCLDAAVVPGTFFYAAFAYDGSTNYSDAAVTSASVTTQPACLGCHGGNPDYPLAPNVVDGPLPGNASASYSWYGSLAGTQDGGHGDPDNRPASSCTDCHDLSQPPPGDLHGNGVLESVFDAGGGTANTAHLKAEFFQRFAPPALPVGAGAWSLQVTFDNYCAFRCHPAAGVGDMRHEIDTLPGDANHWSVEFGTHNTVADGESLWNGRPYPIDADLSTSAGGGPDFATCVTCHDPHGTTVRGLTRPSGRMMRDPWRRPSVLCAACHL